jgi:hypothetical protein
MTPKVVARDGAEHRLELLGLQEPDSAVRGARRPRSVDERHRVRGRPFALDREGEDAVQEIQVVLDRLARQAILLLDLEVGLDVGAVDLVQRPAAEERRHVPAQVPAVVLQRRALALHDVLEVLEVELARLGHRVPLRAGDDRLRRDPMAQLGLGLRAGQPVRRAGPALGSDPPLDPSPADPP